MAKLGCLDSVEDGIAKGWALDQGRHSPAEIDICVDGSVVDTVACSEFRSDLLAAKRGNGWHGFTYPLPVRYMRSLSTLIIKFAGNGPLLENGRRILPDFTGRVLTSSALQASVLNNGLWCIDQLSLSDYEIAVEGWAIAPHGMPLPVAFTHNGDLLGELVRFGRDDIAALLDLPRDEIGCGFRARGPARAGTPKHEFFFQHALTKRPFDPNQSIHYIFSEAALAPDHFRARVHGSTDPMSFIKEGATAFSQMQRFLGRYFSKSIEDFASVLDWGCGSGRMLRYFPSTALKSLTGIDIDEQAIEWCRQAFPDGRFVAVAPEPPTPFPAESFDLIYANSVLTHLRQKDHLQWLRELFRVARPGAVLLLTTAGERSWWGRKFPSSRFVEWRVDCHGFYEGGRNTNLDEIGVGDYYRNVFISADYIQRNWSELFEIVDFVPGGIGNLQDLTILRKRE